MSVFGWIMTVIAAILGAMLLVVLFFVARAAYFIRRRGSFVAYIRPDGVPAWVRGIGRYGTYNLAWFKLASWKLGPELMFSRRGVDIVGAPEHIDTSSLVLLHMKTSRKNYDLLVEEGVASGLISWAGSSPPEDRTTI